MISSSALIAISLDAHSKFISSRFILLCYVVLHIYTDKIRKCYTENEKIIIIFYSIAILIRCNICFFLLDCLDYFPQINRVTV
jgi:hypothetical protein